MLLWPFETTHKGYTNTCFQVQLITAHTISISKHKPIKWTFITTSVYSANDEIWKETTRNSVTASQTSTAQQTATMHSSILCCYITTCLTIWVQQANIPTIHCVTLKCNKQIYPTWYSHFFFFVNNTSFMQFVRYLLYPSQLYMFQMSLPSILRSTGMYRREGTIYVRM